MPTRRAIVDALRNAAHAGEAVVLATVVRVVGSSYGGVGARLLVRVDGGTVGLVSGGCLESDLAEHARRVHSTGRPEVITYDTRADDDAVWGLGLGCNGTMEVLVEPLDAEAARLLAEMLARALSAASTTAIATVVRGAASHGAVAAVGAHALIDGNVVQSTGDWGDGELLATLADHGADALTAGRLGHFVECGDAHIAFEAVHPAVRLVICGSGPDVVPVARLAVGLGWDVTVVDHRAAEDVPPGRFPGARVVECRDPARIADSVALGGRTAAVVMSHHFVRDTGYLEQLLHSSVNYVGVLGPRARTERMLVELASGGVDIDAATGARDRLYAPVGLDIGGEGPEGIALAIVAEVAAVMNGRATGHLRDRAAALHAATRG